jgi:hypothetical protein
MGHAGRGIGSAVRSGPRRPGEQHRKASFLVVGMDRSDGRTGTEFVGAGVDVVREASIDVRERRGSG